MNAANIPVELIRSLESTKGFDEKAFMASHEHPVNFTSIRINPAKLPLPAQLDFHDLVHERVPWSSYGYYLRQRPSFTFDPLFHAGTYYVQEASSMFLEQVIRQWSNDREALRVLDLSAAPGGKSTHLQSLLPDGSLLVSNDVIRSRAKILEDNIIRWGASNVVVTNNDPRDFSRLGPFFDIIIVDAPCSGSGLFRKDPDATGEWSPENVVLCSQRQQRILSDIWPALQKNGLLVYSTCSYSVEENEQIAEWILSEFPVKVFPVDTKKEWGITETGGGFRFWPDKVKGEGFYMIAFEKQEGEDPATLRHAKKTDRLTSREITITEKWMETREFEMIRAGEVIYAWPLAIASLIPDLLTNLRVLYSGIRIGELVRDKIVPDHALALSGKQKNEVPFLDLDKTQALQYLGKKDLQMDPVEKGWQVVRYREHELGWINALSNRINNYYPKQLRILKDDPGVTD